MNKFYLSIVVLLTSVYVPVLQACSTCMCGDPTLTTMGVEKPFTGRQRISITTLQREEKVGVPGVNQNIIDETRTVLGYSYWPSQALALGVRVPYVSKELERSNLEREEASALGDIDVDLRLYLWQDSPGVPKHIFGIQTGVRVPTASQEKANGIALDNDVQPGDDLWLANVGLWHGYFKFPWMLYSSAQLNIGLNEGFEDFDYGGSLKVSSTAQYAINYSFALQLGVDMRWSEKDEFGGVTDEDSGGFIAFLSPGMVITLVPDLIAHLKIQTPWIEELNGDHEEEQVVQLGLTYDF